MSADKVQALQKIRQKRRDVALAAYKRYERAIDEAKVVWIGEDQYFITRIELIDGWNEGTEWDIMWAWSTHVPLFGPPQVRLTITSRRTDGQASSGWVNRVADDGRQATQELLGNYLASME